MGLEARNALLYGEFRDYPEWAEMVRPPAWLFAADGSVHAQLRELWTLIAETHFIHVLFKMLPVVEWLDAQRELQAKAADETAGHVARILERLRAFAGRHTELKVELGLFDINWAGLWPFAPSESPADEYEAGTDAIVAEVSEELLRGTRFNVSAEAIGEGMTVITVGGEFPSELAVIVVSYDAATQIARCQDLATQAIKEIPIANLRDHAAARSEVHRRIEVMMAGELGGGSATAAIQLELLEEVRSGTRFAVAAEEVEVGMQVCCVGSQFDPMDVNTVVSWDPDTQIVVCRDQVGTTAPVPLAGLRNAAAVIMELMDRVSAMTGVNPFSPN